MPEEVAAYWCGHPSSARLATAVSREHLHHWGVCRLGRILPAVQAQTGQHVGVGNLCRDCDHSLLWSSIEGQRRI